MMKYFMTDNQVIHEEEKLQDGVWVRMISPTQEECEEIADVLNFANQSFFGKYFKHHTGISPKEYRKV